MNAQVTLFVASSSIALHAFECKIKSMTSYQRASAFLISSTSRANYIDFASTNVFVVSPNYKSLFFDYCLHRKIKSLLIKLNLSNVIFYDFALDQLCFIVAKVSLEINLNISIDPVAPLPSIKTLDPTFIEYILFIALRIYSFPVGLYSFKTISSKDEIPSYLRLAHPSITILEYKGIQSVKNYAMKTAPCVKYLYIEGCEARLSTSSKNLIHTLLNDLSLHINLKTGFTLFVKARPFGVSFFQIDEHNKFSLLDSKNLPCETLDLSGVNLLTIASFGALSRFECKVISVISIFNQLISNPNDKKTLNSQFAYAQTFKHPQIYYPSSFDELFGLL